MKNIIKSWFKKMHDKEHRNDKDYYTAILIDSSEAIRKCKMLGNYDNSPILVPDVSTKEYNYEDKPEYSKTREYVPVFTYYEKRIVIYREVVCLGSTK